MHIGNWMALLQRQSRANDPITWNEMVVGYDFGLLKQADIQAWVHSHGFHGAACERLVRLEGEGLERFEETLWEACRECTGKLPRPGGSRWSAAQDRWRLALIQDALQAHPSISVVISSWDDMTRGAKQAIQAAHKKPATDVRIYSVGATKDGVAKIKQGLITESTVLLPYEESYYAVLQLIRKLATGVSTAGFTNEADSPAVTNGPKTIFITKANAATFAPEY